MTLKEYFYHTNMYGVDAYTNGTHGKRCVEVTNAVVCAPVTGKKRGRDEEKK